MDCNNLNGALDFSLTEDLRVKLQQSRSVRIENPRTTLIDDAILLQVLQQAFTSFKHRQIFLSFNGGKDCTVLLHLINFYLKDSACDLKVIYFRSSDPFPEIEAFVQSCEAYYKIKIEAVQADASMKEVLTGICESDKEIKACIMGSRRTDPYCENLDSFHVGQSRMFAMTNFYN